MSITREYLIEQGFKKVKLSKKAHNKFVRERKVGLLTKGEYYLLLDDENKRFYYRINTNLLGKIYSVVVFPLVVLAEGIRNYRVAVHFVKESFKKYNNFDYITWIKFPQNKDRFDEFVSNIRY